MYRRIYLFILGLALVSTGCINTKKFVYFNDLDHTRSGDVIDFKPLQIQEGDILQVTVSTIDKDITLLFNPNAINNNSSNNVSNPIAQGYLVDSEGNIELPMVGKVNVKGKSTTDVNATIKRELNKTLKNAFVSTRLLNFRISVLGDVAKPGTFNIPNERVSLLDALSMAGDLNITAVRDDVLLIRETNGKKTYISINLNDSKTLAATYFYLINNDVLYVKPGSNKVFNSSRGFQLLPTILSGLSLVTVILSTILK